MNLHNLICKLKELKINKVIVYETAPDLCFPEEIPETPPNKYFVNDEIKEIVLEEAEALKAAIIDIATDSSVVSLKYTNIEDFGDTASMTGELHMEYTLDLNNWTLEVAGGWQHGPEDCEILELTDLKLLDL